MNDRPKETTLQRAIRKRDERKFLRYDEAIALAVSYESSDEHRKRRRRLKR